MRILVKTTIGKMLFKLAKSRKGNEKQYVCENRFHCIISKSYYKSSRFIVRKGCIGNIKLKIIIRTIPYFCKIITNSE
jgi:hypothetical protein